MAALAAESILTGLCVNAVMPEDMARWLRWRNFATAILPGIWFIFSLSFSRVNYKELLSRWKWITAALFILPLATVILFGDGLFIGKPVVSPSLIWILRLSWPGYIFHFFMLAGATLILMNLEQTLRNSTGHFRWQIKFMILGLGCIFAVRIYTVSQAMLFHSMTMALELVNDAAVIVAVFLIAKSLLRTRLLNVDFYMSQTSIYNSLTILVVGVYLIAVGGLARITLHFNGGQSIPFVAFIILLAVIGLFVFLLSDRLRKRTKRFISRHFKRPIYDYRKEWTKFTLSTTSVMDIKDLCNAVVKTVSRTFDVLSVTIWILDELQETAILEASTVFSEGKSEEIKEHRTGIIKFASIIRDKNIPYDLDYLEEELPKGLQGFNKEFFDGLHLRYCLPLIAGDRLLGLMTLDNRVGGSPLTVEDFDLLKNMVDQLAASLLNLILSERLRKAKEMEAFQTMSAFFVHDLKNLASKLSLTMQNLPIHYENPEFRDDTLRTISRSLEKINLMSHRLTSLSEKLELSATETDMNEFVSKILSGLDGSLRGKITEELQPLRKALVDPEQIQKVLTNLILNAHEATNETGQIFITTGQKNGWIFISVRDNGCGMSREFMDKSLFHPFQTTKNKGMGIGLYHSKTIIEAHKGKIEVESEEGKGSVFRVLLPLEKDKGSRNKGKTTDYVARESI